MEDREPLQLFDNVEDRIEEQKPEQTGEENQELEKYDTKELEESNDIQDKTEKLLEEEESTPTKEDFDLNDSVKRMEEKLETLTELFEKRIQYTDHEEKTLDRMHKELQIYKNDLYTQLISPVLQDIIQVRDSITRMTDFYLQKPEGEQAIPNQTFSMYAVDLQDILEKHNVEVYQSNTGDKYTPVRQKVLEKTKTNNEDLHGKISETLTCGYSYKGRILSPERVNVYFYEQAPETEKSEVEENV